MQHALCQNPESPEIDDSISRKSRYSVSKKIKKKNPEKDSVQTILLQASVIFFVNITLYSLQLLQKHYSLRFILAGLLSFQKRSIAVTK